MPILLATVRDSMPEPSGLGDELLWEWAAFARDDRAEGHNSWSVQPRTDKAYHGDPPDRWFLVNKIVCRFQADPNDRLYPVIKHWYLGEKMPWQIALDLNRSEYHIRSAACWACEQVRREYLDAMR